MKIQLKKPYEFEGKTYKDLEFDLEGLTGVDVSAAKRDWLRSGGYSSLDGLRCRFRSIPGG